MRLVAVALLAGWMVAWSAAPHGEAARSTSVVGAVAIAGSDTVAVAWIELRGRPHIEALHVAIVDDHNAIRDAWELPVEEGATSFQLADAGGGRFVLATERRSLGWRAFDVNLLAHGSRDPLPSFYSARDGRAWQLAAAGTEIAIVEELPTGANVFTPTRALNEWRVRTSAGRVLLGTGGGHVVRYEEDVDNSVTLSTSEQTIPLARATCTSKLPAEVTSVVGLRGGYARLARHGADGCVEGIADGRPFVHRSIPLAGFRDPRLAVEADGTLTIHDAQDARTIERRVILPRDVTGGAPVTIEATSINEAIADDGVRYRLFAGEGRLGMTDVATRASRNDIEVVLERQGPGTATVLAPEPSFEADHRPVLRPLALLPLLAFVLALAFAILRLVRLRRLTPRDVEKDGLGSGAVTLAGTLVADADAPRGALRVRVGHKLVTVFVEGAAVLRASDVRARTQPRGDAVDVAAGAPVVARGTLVAGDVYRDEPTLRARTGDLLLVGCTIAEARAQATRAVVAALITLAAVTTVIGTVITR